MRIAIWSTVIALLGVSLSAQTAAQKPPKKGDTIIVRGCLRGSAVEAADLMVEDTEGEVKQNDAVPDMTYRLQGDKNAFVDPEGYLAYIDLKEKEYRRKLAEQREGGK